MPAVPSSWFVGSIELPAQTFAVVQGATSENCVIAAGTYYLRHATAGLSLIDAMVTAINSHSLVSGAAVVVQRNRIIRLSATQAFTLTWPADNVLRGLFGATANLTPAATSHTVAQISPLLWSPGWPAIPRTIAGVAGYSVDHKKRYKSDDGQRSHTHYLGSETWQDLELDHVVASRMRVTPSVGGTFHEFYEQCAKLGERFAHYELVTEDSDSTTAVTWTTALGPYVLRDNFDGDWYQRRVKNADVSCSLELPLHVIAEAS